MSRITLVPDTYVSASQRKKGFKGTGVGVETEEGRRRRHEDLFMIRKNSRKDSIYKRRKHPREDVSAPLVETLPFTIYIPERELLKSQLKAFPAMKEALFSDDADAQLEACAQCGKMLSKGYIPHIDKVIRAGIVPRLVTFLTRDEMPQLQCMAAWTLANIASGLSEHTRTVIEHGAIQLLVQLLSSGSEDIKEQAMWALSNIAGDSPSARDDVFNHGALSPLLSVLWSPTCITKISTWTIATWTFSNLCIKKPLPMLLEQIPPALPAIRELLSMQDEEIILHGCHTLCCLTQKESIELNQAIIDANVCPRLLELLVHPKSKVIVPALRTIGYISSCSESHNKVLIDSGGLPVFNFLLKQSEKFILKEVCWIISNISGGNKDHIQAILDADLVSSLVHLTKADFEISQPAAWAIVNSTCHATHEQIRLLSSLGCIEALCDLLTLTDSNLLIECLDGLNNILIVGKVNMEKGLYNGVNIYAGMIEECGGLDKIANLQNYENDEIYNRVVSILVDHFRENLDIEDQNLQNSPEETVKEGLEVDDKNLHNSVEESAEKGLEVDDKNLRNSLEETAKEGLEVYDKNLHNSAEETAKEGLDVDDKNLHNSAEETPKEGLEVDDKNLHNSAEETAKEGLEVDDKNLHNSVEETAKEGLEVAEDEKNLHISVDETLKEDLEVDKKNLHNSVDETMKDDLEVDEKNLHNSVDDTLKEDLEVDEKNLHDSVDETMKEEDQKNLHNSVDETMKEDLQVDEQNLHNSVDETMEEDLQVDDTDLLNNVVKTMKENLHVDEQNLHNSVDDTIKEDLQVDDQDLLNVVDKTVKE